MTDPGTTVKLDGSVGEGGGALVRTAVSLSAFTQRPLRLEQVRAGTDYPGLDAEDLLIIEALAQSCGAETQGVELGSSAFSFFPTNAARNLDRTLENPDSARQPNALTVLHSIAPNLARAGAYSRLEAVGETFGHRSLGFDAYLNGTCMAMRALGLYSYPELLHAGYGRESKGRVVLEIEPSALRGIDWQDRGRLVRCRGLITYSSITQPIVQRGLSHLRHLATHAGLPLEVHSEAVRADRSGIHITLWAHFERGCGSASAMGARGIRVEALGQRAFSELFDWLRSDATTDPYLADQLLLPSVFSESPCHYTTPILTPRLMTSVWVAKQFLPIHLTVKGQEGGPGSISVRQ